MKNGKLNEQKWVRQILKDYGNLEAQPKVVDSIVEAWPDWVFNLWPILFATCQPGLNFKNIKKWTARDLGQFLGRQSALGGLIWDEIPLSPRVRDEKDRWIEQQMPKISSNPEFALTLIREIQNGQEKWRSNFREFIAKTLAAAQLRPYPESSAFFEAFGRANVIKPDELATERRIGVGERIAYVMLLFWRDIANFESVAQLHHLLSSAAKPMGIEITLKRVEKLCQRTGLKFKGRGRPKRKIQTNLPAAS